MVHGTLIRCAPSLSARCGAAHRVRYLIDDQTAVVVVVDISRHADTYGTD
jgi:mRNA-degrading endonuclease RelE of RelBE toxin-antitoxin system